MIPAPTRAGGRPESRVSEKSAFCSGAASPAAGAAGSAEAGPAKALKLETMERRGGFLFIDGPSSP